MASRPLTDDEKAEARDVFEESVDVSGVRITRDRPWTLVAPVALGLTVHLKSSWDHFQGDSLRLTPLGRSVLVHELVHVWQYQHGGWAYAAISLWAQHAALWRTGSRRGAYLWEDAIQQGLAWRDWNPEQQAQAIQDWRDARVRVAQSVPRQGDLALIERLAPCVVELRAGRGAPTLDAVMRGASAP